MTSRYLGGFRELRTFDVVGNHLVARSRQVPFHPGLQEVNDFQVFALLVRHQARLRLHDHLHLFQPSGAHSCAGLHQIHHSVCQP